MYKDELCFNTWESVEMVAWSAVALLRMLSTVLFTSMVGLCAAMPVVQSMRTHHLAKCTHVHVYLAVYVHEYSTSL